MRIVLGLAVLGALALAGSAWSAPAPASCATASWVQLRPLLAGAPTRSLAPATLILSQGENNDIDVVGAVGTSTDPDKHRFRVFTFDASGVADTPSGVDPDQVSHPSQDASAALHIVDPTNAYDLRTRLPVTPGWAPWRSAQVIVVACQGAQVVAVARKDLLESRALPSGLLAAAAMLGLYVMAATMVWQARGRAIKWANDAHAEPPQRVVPLKRWAWRRCLNPVVMTSDEFDRGSLSNLQILFFAGLVGYGLTNLALRSGALSNLSSAIIYLLGIPAVGSLGHVVAKASRDRFSTDNWAWLVNRGVLPINDLGNDQSDNGGPKWSDLVMNETVLDLPRLQALTFSLIVGVAMVATGFRDFADFNVPTSLLEILGLSQGVFVLGGFTQPPTIGDTDKVLDTLRARAQELIGAAASGRDVDGDGKPLPANAPPPPPTTARHKGLFKPNDKTPDAPSRAPPADPAAAVPNALQRYKEAEEKAVVLLKGLTHRDVDVRGLINPLDWNRSAAIKGGTAEPPR